MSARYKSFDRNGRSITMSVPSDDGGDQEAAYCEAITAIVTADPAEFMVDTWLDEFKLADRWYDGPQKGSSDFRLASLRTQLLYVLRANCDELERAENAARMGGASSFSEWLEEECNG